MTGAFNAKNSGGVMGVIQRMTKSPSDAPPAPAPVELQPAGLASPRAGVRRKPGVASTMLRGSSGVVGAESVASKSLLGQ